MISNNYRQSNVPDKSGDAKLVNVFTTGNQIRVNATPAGKINVRSLHQSLNNHL